MQRRRGSRAAFFALCAAERTEIVAAVDAGIDVINARHLPDRTSNVHSAVRLAAIWMPCSNADAGLPIRIILDSMRTVAPLPENLPRPEMVKNGSNNLNL